jgi:class 3 adenylate cyclase
MNCTNCGREIDGQANFCPRCGNFQRKYEQLPLEDMRLTFMRADLSGFTGLSESLTAEEVMAFLNEIFSTFSMVITAHKGVIYQIIGDEIVSIFGMRKESGFTPHMAVMAAEEIFKKLSAFNKKASLKSEIGLKIGMELDAASIYHVRGSIQNSLIVTDGFKKSLVLQKNAEANSVLTGENLYQATKSFFKFTDFGEIVEDEMSVKAYFLKL